MISAMTFLVIGLIVSVAAFALYTVALSRLVRSDGQGQTRISGLTPRSHQPDEFELRHWW